MGPAIALRLRQHLTLTPQVQQALRLLQMSALEFAQEMEQALTANPFLEENTEAPAPAKEVAAEEVSCRRRAPAGRRRRSASRTSGAALPPRPSRRCPSTCASSCACRASASATARWPGW